MVSPSSSNSQSLECVTTTWSNVNKGHNYSKSYTKAKAKGRHRVAYSDVDTIHDSGFSSAAERSDTPSSPCINNSPPRDHMTLLPCPPNIISSVEFPALQRRERTYSTPIASSSRRRISCLSTSSIMSTKNKKSLDIPKAPATPPISSANAEHVSMGSFTPTSSAEKRLRSFFACEKAEEVENTSRSLRLPISPRTWAALTLKPKWTTRSTSKRIVPSICRSPSPTATPPVSPESPASPTSTLHLNGGPWPGPSPSPLSKPVQIDPLLAALENASRLRSRVVCVACGKCGSDFPRCPTCGDAWCTRECRIVGNNGRKHVCRMQAA
ncbi:hypothetical protein BD410DRAFT_797672 [Rickenella mellea]|uniref:Uncharacterized protein n=1 Tax=Rickenella mellea TaxID=50990 RepID=A0A4Y7PDH3_9AGAM|nr:hypothetical protein BD410DRAFT_797672 [Rickenella mellea]